ncbi:glycoside hydrolase family 57 [Thiorhodococcus minor]|uniref:Glycoside hydrolase family 57 n=1 Tax=Thiorhodococcus minor TaxID=57489 RepID=A0A6M0JTU0_9GAMM|nr:glycoside hydrolase family 57 [Thiorhodococcus minor]NEV60902.1 glycoside hydrolase family 57 [Thiorhodococcus minor]
MAERTVFHALGLHMHQPPGNLRLLIDAKPREAEEIVLCYERAVRYAERYADVARLHVGFSGVLLEQLLDPVVVDRYRHIVDIPRMLDRYRAAGNIELVGMGHYHPIFPLIPCDDWLEQLERGRGIMERVFARVPRGFWPPETAFTIEMIPALIQAGYEYVVVDGARVMPEDGVSDGLRPYSACYDGLCMTVIPQDRDLSRAQAGGLDPQWLEDELQWRASVSPRPDAERLFTSWSDGENGGWLRQTTEPAGFFGRFFAPYMELCRTGHCRVSPVFIGDYLERVKPLSRATIQTGAWNAGRASDSDLLNWAGSSAQREAMAQIRRLSRYYWSLCRCRPDGYEVAGDAMVRARQLILEAETSCFLCWGDAWIPHLYARTIPAEAALDDVARALRQAGVALDSGSGAAGQGCAV